MLLVDWLVYIIVQCYIVDGTLEYPNISFLMKIEIFIENED